MSADSLSGRRMMLKPRWLLINRCMWRQISPRHVLSACVGPTHAPLRKLKSSVRRHIILASTALNAAMSNYEACKLQNYSGCDCKECVILGPVPLPIHLYMYMVIIPFFTLIILMTWSKHSGIVYKFVVENLSAHRYNQHGRDYIIYVMMFAAATKINKTTYR
jgi:hypothetical protein